MSETVTAPSPADTRGADRPVLPALEVRDPQDAAVHGREVTADVSGNLVLSNDVKHIRQNSPEVTPTGGHIN